jgi:hypothetical protein
MTWKIHLGGEQQSVFEEKLPKPSTAKGTRITKKNIPKPSMPGTQNMIQTSFTNTLRQGRAVKNNDWDKICSPIHSVGISYSIISFQHNERPISTVGSFQSSLFDVVTIDRLNQSKVFELLRPSQRRVRVEKSLGLLQMKWKGPSTRTKLFFYDLHLEEN